MILLKYVYNIRSIAATIA